MRVFIFQSRDDWYDLREKIVPGQPDTWWATRYRNIMSPRDIVLFWMAGKPEVRGLYGWGKLTSKPYYKEDWGGYGVNLVYKVKFTHHIPSSKIENDERLKDLLVIRAPSATNFYVKEHHQRRLFGLIKRCNEKAPPNGGRR